MVNRAWNGWGGAERVGGGRRINLRPQILRLLHQTREHSLVEPLLQLLGSRYRVVPLCMQLIDCENVHSKNSD